MIPFIPTWRSAISDRCCLSTCLISYSLHILHSILSQLNLIIGHLNHHLNLCQASVSTKAFIFIACLPALISLLIPLTGIYPKFIFTTTSLQFFLGIMLYFPYYIFSLIQLFCSDNIGSYAGSVDGSWWTI
jgi:hypothetical protein